MGDTGGAKRGHGQGRGRGRGRGGQGGQTQAIKNLERAAADIQNMLGKLTTDDQGTKRGSTAERKKGTRGSKSLMDLSFDDSSASHQRYGHQGAANQNPYYPPPHGQGAPYHGPPHQGPPYHGPPHHQGPPYHGPPHQGPPYHGPPHQGPPYHGPPHQGPPYHGPPGQGHYYGPPDQRAYQGGQHDGGHSFPPAPPPSYEESVRQSDRKARPPPPQNKGKAPEGKSKTVSVQELVKSLVMFGGQMADTEAIGKQTESTAQEVEKAVKKHKNIFAHMKDGNKVVVELVPNIKLCSAYLSPSGCTARDFCQDLHLCRSFIVTRCDQGPSCPLGHKLDTNHNASILSKLYLDLIKPHDLLGVIRKVCRGSGPPRVCSYYATEKGCTKKDDCRFLHICKDYVMNDGKCSTQNCPFNHQLNTKQCRTVLAQHGVSTNESIRDILMKVKSSLDRNPRNPSPAVPNKKTTTREERDDGESESSSGSDGSQTPEASVRKKRNKTKEKDAKGGEKPKGKHVTLRSTDFCGDVEVPEICVYAVSNKCMNEKKGCKYLHAKSLFHWQVKKEGKWYNFRIFQSKALESAYRNVSQNSVMLPPIHADKLSPEDQNILELLGPNNWTANFKEMCIADPKGNKLNIRRVSTPSSAMSSLPQATVYEWYFLDDQGKWIPYGQVDSLGKQELVCNMTSQDIEKHYIADSSTTIVVTNARFTYKIDFTNMTQTNTSSMKVREIRRRPTRLAYQKPTGTGTATATDSILPSHWKPMTPNQTHVLVTLDTSQPEFQEVSKSIKLMIPTAKICEVRRLQNEYLWRLFQYKKADLSNRYDELTMNVQKLYHGTNSEAINAICKENVDGRRYASTKDKYGKGTYFSNSSAIARTYCTPDGQGHFFIILAEVIIGYVTQGSKNITRPPLNPLTGHPYDTTVDSMTAPTVFVKYDKEEYYPEYIIEIV